MTKKSKTTVVDVAKSAGVAVGTVSRVMNNHPEVDATIRARVWQAARNLNYSRLRQRSARSNQNGGTVTTASHIAAVFFGMEDTLVQLPVVSAALQGIEGMLSAHGRSLMLANIPAGDRVPPFLTEEHRVDGLILKGPNQGLLPAAEQSILLQHIARVPHVWLMGRLPNATGDHCNFDTDIASRLAAEHLFVKGHRRVAFLNPKPGQSQFEKLKMSFAGHAARLGCVVSLLEVAAPAHREWPLPAITHEDNVSLLVERWSRLPARNRPTAVFVPADRTSVQLFGALARRNIEVASDLSVISCNNEHSLLANLRPELTSIEVHAEAIGRRAVEQLLWRIRHPRDLPYVQVLVEPGLVERKSVAQL